MKKIYLFFLIFIFNNLYAVLFIDDVGRKNDIDIPVKKIVCLSPAHTEMIYYLNAQEKLVAVSENCNFPQDTKEKQKAGTFLNPDIEKIIKLKPDIIISGGGIQKKAVKKLESLNFRVLVLYPQSIKGIINNMELLCELTGAKNEKIKKFKDELKPFKINRRIKTYLELWDKPEMAIGGKSFINEVVEFAGGENIFKDAISEYPKVSSEEILKRNPQVILFFYDTQNINEILKKTNAFKKNKIFILSKNKQDIFLRPGPRIIEAIKFLNKIYREILDEE